MLRAGRLLTRQRGFVAALRRRVFPRKEVSGNVAQTCRYYGISRQTFYAWYRRYEEKGLAGLRDRSKRPLTSPKATQIEVVEKIIYLRANCHFGPEKIQMYLRRYHDITISRSEIWRFLKRLDMKPTAELAVGGLPSPGKLRPQVEGRSQ